ncbi:MAG: hypothetical protein ACT4NV_15670 [Rhodoferax sp.]
MPTLTLLALLAAALYFAKTQQQLRRIALLGAHLGRYRLETLMESLTEGYLRALAEPDPERQQAQWALLGQTEAQLADQMQRLAQDFSSVDSPLVRVGKWPLYLPFATSLVPAASFDMRQALALHAHSLRQALESAQGLSRRDRAYRVCAELFLFQHSCHWFCRSKSVASVRLMARHRTSYVQVLDSIAPESRARYLQLVSL